MTELLEAKVRSLGGTYADGTPHLEINLPAASAAGLSFVNPERTPITLRLGKRDYAGAVLANKPHHTTVWFSPTLIGPNGKRVRLGAILADAGIKANDTVWLAVNGTVVGIHVDG